MFNNRSEAGKMLAEKLRRYTNLNNIILAVPRGGVTVAYEIARELNLPLEVMLVKKLGHPNNKEYAIGAVGLTEMFVFPHQGVTNTYIEAEVQQIRKRLQQMKEKFVSQQQMMDLKGKSVIVVDDGVATGLTLLATLKILQKTNPAKIIVAVPVISKSAAEKISTEADELVALLIPENLRGVGNYYRDFTQVTDDEVIYCLQKLRELKQTG